MIKPSSTASTPPRTPGRSTRTLPAADVLERYRRETDRADEIITATPADAPLAWWPHHLFGPPHLHSHRDVLLHVITETACHAGHLDAARELIDGRRWLVLTEDREADRS